MSRSFYKQAYQASALVITLMFIVLLGLEALIVGLVLTRSTGTEAVLRGKNSSVRRASELVLNTLSSAIYSDIVSNSLTSAQVYDKYKRGGTSSTYSTLTANRYTTTNPESGATDALNIDTSAWVQEYRGYNYHLVGRAKQDDVDLITHKWVLVKPCSTQNTGTGILTTIATSLNYPGYRSTVVDPTTGRVFFGVANDTDTSSTPFYSWHSSTGLSTLASGRGIGNRSTFIASDGRVFFGAGPGGGGVYTDKIYTWKDGILSTINPSGMRGAGRSCDGCGMQGGYYGTYSSYLDSRNDRLYIGSGDGSSPLLTWKNNILTTIYSDGTVFNEFALGAEDEFFFARNTGSGNWELRRWTPADGLTLASSGSGGDLSISSMSGMTGGRVWFGRNNTIYNWHSGLGLTTITGTFNSTFGIGWFQEAATGEMVFSDYNKTFSWSPSSPTAFTDLNQGSAAGSSIQSTDRSLAAVSATNSFFVWTPSHGVSTIVVDSNTGSGYGAAFYGNTWLYFGQDYSSAADLYAWNFSTRVLSTLTPAGMYYQGIHGSTMVDATGRAYFGSASTTNGKVVSYKPGSGLTTIISTNRNAPGKYAMATHPNGGVYFGEANASGNFYFYTPGNSECSTRPY